MKPIYVVVESHAVANVLQLEFRKIVTEPLTVIATGGHLFDFYREQNANGLKLKANENNRQAIEVLKNIDGAPLIIATDSDEQGELLANHITQLTPHSKFKRCIFNDLSTMGIMNSLVRLNKSEFDFNHKLAVRAAIKKITNLHLKHSSFKSSFKDNYNTTTSIAIVKEMLNSDIPELQKFIEVKTDEGHYDVSFVTSKNNNSTDQIEEIKQLKHLPTTSKDLLLHHIASNNKSSLMRELQKSFAQQKISYIRTDCRAFPATAMKSLKDFTLVDGDDYDDSFIITPSNIPHFAIHNVAIPVTDLEQKIASLNRSALTSKTTNESRFSIKTPNSLRIQSGSLRVKPTTHQSITLTPEQMMSYILLNTADASPSTIEDNAKKYSRLLINDSNRPRMNLIKELDNQAHKNFPRLYDMGINKIIDQQIAANANITESITSISPSSKLMDVEDSLATSLSR